MGVRFPWRRRPAVPSVGGTTDRQPRVLLGCGAVGVLVAVVGPLVSEIGAILVCLTCLGCYAALSSRHGTAPALSAAADEVYLLGYLFTISALLGIGLQLGIGPGPLAGSQTKLLFLAGTKLSTTVVGLLSMLYLKALAKAGPPLDASPETDRVQLIQEIIHAFMEHDLQKFHHTQNSLLATQETLNSVLRDTASHLERTLRAVAQLNTESQQVSASMEKLNTSLKHTKELAPNLERTLPAIARLNTESQQVGASMEKLNTSLVKIVSNTHKLSSTQDALNHNMTGTIDNVKNMKAILDDFVSLVETKLFEYEPFGKK